MHEIQDKPGPLFASQLYQLLQDVKEKQLTRNTHRSYYICMKIPISSKQAEHNKMRNKKIKAEIGNCLRGYLKKGIWICLQVKKCLLLCRRRRREESEQSFTRIFLI